MCIHLCSNMFIIFIFKVIYVSEIWFIFILYIIYVYVSEIYLGEQTLYVTQADSNLPPHLYVQCAGTMGAQGPFPEPNSSSVWHEE